MAIQVRRGLEADFDADKMLPGEWAVSTDTKYVRMCFAPGIVLRMATYESFEMDKAQIKDILEDCKTIEAAIIRIQTEVNEKAKITVEYAKDALNAANKAEEYARNAKTYADNASAVTGVTIATKDRAGLVKGGENSIAEDGTLELAKVTMDRILINSYAANANIKAIMGKSEQDEVPTIEYIVPIKHVGDDGDLVITATGKNHIDIPNGTYQETASFWCNLEAGEYIFSAETFNSTGADFLRPYSLIFYRENNGEIVAFGGVSAPGTSKTIPFETRYPIVKIEICSAETPEKSIGHSFTVKNAMIRKEGTNNIYAPYQGSNSITISLAEPLRQYDKIVKQDGVWGIERGTKSNVFNGSETWVASAALTGRYGVVLDAKENSRCLCTVAVNGTNGSTVSGECFINQNGDFYINTEFGTVVEWKAHLAENSITVDYELLTTTFEPFDTDTQIELNSLMTYDSATYISTNSEVEPVIEFEYATSLVGKIALEAVTIASRNEILINELRTLTNSISTAMVEREE